MNKNRTYRIFLRKEKEGIYTVIVPSLPGCITWGENVEHAIDMAKEAIGAYVEVLKEDGEPIPDDSETFEYSLQLSA